MPINLENPKTFLPLLLFIGFVLILVGTGVESATSNPALVNDGWVVIGISVILWIISRRV